MSRERLIVYKIYNPHKTYKKDKNYKRYKEDKEYKRCKRAFATCHWDAQKLQTLCDGKSCWWLAARWSSPTRASDWLGPGTRAGNRGMPTSTKRAFEVVGW